MKNKTFRKTILAVAAVATTAFASPAYADALACAMTDAVLMEVVANYDALSGPVGDAALAQVKINAAAETAMSLMPRSDWSEEDQAPLKELAIQEDPVVIQEQAHILASTFNENCPTMTPYDLSALGAE